MENEENVMIKVKTFISTLPATERELKFLLKRISVFNKSKQIFRFNIVGNSYVMSILKEMELDNKLKMEDMVEDKDQLTTALDTGSFTSDNVDFFINLVWTQIEDSNYPETNLKEDFDKACKFDEEDLFNIGAIFHVSYKKITVSDSVDINELKRVKILKKDMENKTIVSDYGSLMEFQLIFKELMEGFKNPKDLGDVSDIFAGIFSEMGLNISPSNGDSEDLNNLISLLDEDKLEEFSEEVEERNQKKYGVYDDIFQYLEKTFEELDNLGDIFKEEKEFVLKDLYHHSKSLDKAIEVLTNFSKVFSKLSTEYEHERDENCEFRRKSLGVLLSFSESDDPDSKVLLEFFADSKDYFEELSEVIENYVDMFFGITDIFPLFEDENYDKKVDIIIDEFDRILDNIKFIKTEINDLNNKFSKKLNG
ncbi:MAG: hypothetical protein FWH29_06320 [Methanobrevibacter sp.]|nr:hypothetical protein [Methanobrevibacter sp.]